MLVGIKFCGYIKMNIIRSTNKQKIMIPTNAYIFTQQTRKEERRAVEGNVVGAACIKVAGHTQDVVPFIIIP